MQVMLERGSIKRFFFQWVCAHGHKISMAAKRW
jgi:hypothetical protein